MYNDQNKQSLSKEQKVGFSLLFVFALLTIGLGFLQLRNNIYGPFAYITPETPSVLYQDLEQQEMIRLQSIDTDQDGLSDYEEIFFYNTSAYIPDTDSDGVTDKEEINKNEDPNCPIGKICGAPADALPKVNQEIQVPETLQVDTSSLFAPFQNQVDINTFKEVLQDPQEVKTMLLDSGMVSEQQLRNISDKELINIVNTIFAENTQEASETIIETEEDEEPAKLDALPVEQSITGNE